MFIYKLVEHNKFYIFIFDKNKLFFIMREFDNDKKNENKTQSHIQVYIHTSIIYLYIYACVCVSKRLSKINKNKENVHNFCSI